MISVTTKTHVRVHVFGCASALGGEFSKTSRAQ